MKVSHYNDKDDLGEHKHMQTKGQGSQIGPKSPSPQALMLSTKHTILYVTNVKDSLQLFSFNKRFFLQAWLHIGFFFSRRFYVSTSDKFLCTQGFCKRESHRIFFLTEVLHFHKHTDSPIVGESDMSQVSTCPFIGR